LTGTDIAILSRPEIKGIKNRSWVLWAWSMWTGSWQLDRVKWFRNSECPRGEGWPGSWQTKAASPVPERETGCICSAMKLVVLNFKVSSAPPMKFRLCPTQGPRTPHNWLLLMCNYILHNIVQSMLNYLFISLGRHCICYVTWW
jgi:hypothetical protein